MKVLENKSIKKDIDQINNDRYNFNKKDND